MVILKGDIHGHVNEVIDFIETQGLSDKDTIIILGDVGLNFYQNKTDAKNKRNLANTGVNIFCIHGNHEIRPQNLKTYKESTYWGGRVLSENDYPNIMFAIDGEVFNIPTRKGIKKSLVIGGAYSIDKYYRIYRGLQAYPQIAQYFKPNSIKLVCDAVDEYVEDKNALHEAILEICSDFDFCTKCGWWTDELPSPEIKSDIITALDKHNWEIPIILSHTCPEWHMPTEAFLPGINQSLIDNSMEKWLGTIETKLKYENWYCGHFHIDKTIDKICILFHDFREM